MKARLVAITLVLCVTVFVTIFVRSRPDDLWYDDVALGYCEWFSSPEYFAIQQQACPLFPGPDFRRVDVRKSEFLRFAQSGIPAYELNPDFSVSDAFSLADFRYKIPGYRPQTRR